MQGTRADRLHLAFVVALAIGAALAFYVPALRATGGDWPAPLDDVFIHYDFARATAQGHPFEWIAGQGYSSGETAPLYPFVLALGYAIGFRGLWLGAWAAILAVASLVVMMRGLRQLMADGPGRPLRPEWLSWIGAAFVVGVGILDWSWFSGMETALLGAALVRTLLAARCAREATPVWRPRAQWVAGAWGAVLVLLRPEAGVVVVAVSVVVARRAGSQSAVAAMARTGVPAAGVLGAVLAANRVFTGDAQSAGGLLKLLSANPYLSDVDRARAFAENLGYAYWKVLEGGLSARPALWPLIPSLAVLAVLARRTRALACGCLASALGWTLLAAWNGASRFQNFRYFMPPLTLLLVASALGLCTVRRSRVGAALVGLAASVGLVAGLPRVASQIAFFRDAAKNIHDQHVEVGRRLARIMPEGASVLVGDAGAIAYVSARHAIDALGLGGYHGLPFVQAAVLGEAATVELIERLPPAERPAYMALYPNWFSAITSTFGREIGRVSIEHNVICGGLTKVIYAADWTALGLADDETCATDALDTGDVISEAEHHYVSPAPFGGWTLLDVRDDGAHMQRFDAGRITPEGQSELFTALRSSGGPALLTVRTDDEASSVDVIVGDSPGVPLDDPAPHGPRAWATRQVSLPTGVQAGDSIVLAVRRGTLHDFHVWMRSGNCRLGGKK